MRPSSWLLKKHGNVLDALMLRSIMQELEVISTVVMVGYNERQCFIWFVVDKTSVHKATIVIMSSYRNSGMKRVFLCLFVHIVNL